MTIAPIDHILDGASKVITQYRNKPTFLLYLAVYLDQVQKVEDQTAAVEAAFRVDDATGFRLDWIGRKVGQPRIGSTDDIFRTFIKGRIASNRSRGRIHDVQRVAALVLSSWSYAHFSTTIVVFTSDDLTQEMRQAVWDMLQRAAPAGVLVYLVQTPYTTPFTLGRVSGGGTALATTNTDGSPGPGPQLARIT